jgi:1-deoxy-D-xylulose-5-phosphate reductoisomerase
MNAPTNASSTPDRPVGLAVLGSTGSIGRQTLDVVSHYRDRFRVIALAAGSNVETLGDQIAAFQPDLVAVDCDPRVCHPPLRHPNLLHGQEGLFAAATHPDVDVVVVATSGHSAMMPTAAAIRAGKTIALANKETIVCAGELILPLARECGVEIRPVDSEHSAIWQSLGAANRSDIAKLILTASGGPFRRTPPAELARVTVAEALSHPTWSMGGKITIDSATLMNKGLEVIEARWLFDVDYDKIDVLIHPESIIHSLVEFQDGSQIAQLSLPDMRLPIQYALTYPRHEPGPCHRLSLAEIGSLHFETPDLDRFPALKLAYDAGKAGLTYPTVLSAADDVAVDAFMQGTISFPAIIDIVARTLDGHSPEGSLSWDSIAAADRWARATATGLIPTVDQAVG